jgi:hypothetical protein
MERAISTTNQLLKFIKRGKGTYLGKWKSAEKEFKKEYPRDEEDEEDEEDNVDHSMDEDVMTKQSHRAVLEQLANRLPALSKNVLKSACRVEINMSNHSKHVQLIGQVTNENENKTMCSYVPLNRPQSWIEQPFQQQYIKDNDTFFTQCMAVSRASPYGDVLLGETVLNKDVRDARELSASQVSIDPSIISELTGLWQSEMVPASVVLQFDKMNLYEAGGKFEMHRDTPTNGLIGTVVLVLYQNYKGRADEMPDYVIGDDSFSPMPIGFCSVFMFFSDVPHKVNPLPDGGKRITLTFKVMCDQVAVEQKAQQEPQVNSEATADANAPASAAADTNANASVNAEGHSSLSSRLASILPVVRRELVDALATLARCSAPVGFIMHHDYSRRTVPAGLKGVDSLLREAMEAAFPADKYRLFATPVALYLKSTWNNDEPMFNECETEVRALTDVDYYESLEVEEANVTTDRLLQQDPKLIEWLKSLKDMCQILIPFYSIISRRQHMVIKKEIQQYIEHTGNECQPGNEDSIYVSYALMAVPHDIRFPKTIATKKRGWRESFHFDDDEEEDEDDDVDE